MCSIYVNSIKAKSVLVKFLEDRAVKMRIRRLCIDTMMQIGKVSNRIQHYVMMNRKRKQELIDMWEEQKAEILTFWRNAKNKSPLSNLERRKLMNMPNDLRDTILRLYLDKCKNKHTIAFYKWRETYSISSQELVRKYIWRLKKRIEVENKYFEQNAEDKIKEELLNMGQDSK